MFVLSELKHLSTYKEASNVNIEQVAVIEGLARAAQNLAPMIGYNKGHATAEKLCDRIEEELAVSSPAEELKALQASNLIKQANINKLADVVINTVGTLRLVKDERVVNAWLEELENLAISLKQEEPETQAAVVN